MKKTLLTTLLAVSVTATTMATTVTLRSGNGSIGGNDSQVTFELGPGSSDFAALTASDFTAASTGPAAFIISPNGAWISTLPADGTALWIGTNSGAAGNANTGLYAINFSLPFAVSSASINVNYAVDNTLGGTNEGIFLNGTALTGSAGGNFSNQSTYTSSTIGPLLHAGTNTLYIDAANLGGPAGLIFSATISTQDVVGGGGGTPEPGSVALTLIGIGAIALRSVRKQKRVASLRS